MTPIGELVPKFIIIVTLIVTLLSLLHVIVTTRGSKTQVFGTSGLRWVPAARLFV